MPPRCASARRRRRGRSSRDCYTYTGVGGVPGRQSADVRSSFRGRTGRVRRCGTTRGDCRSITDEDRLGSPPSAAAEDLATLARSSAVNSRARTSTPKKTPSTTTHQASVTADATSLPRPTSGARVPGHRPRRSRRRLGPPSPRQQGPERPPEVAAHEDEPTTSAALCATAAARRMCCELEPRAAESPCGWRGSRDRA